MEMMNSSMQKTLSSQATDWREGRRLRTYELKEQGCKQTQIADALGLTEGALSQWMKRAREQGVEGLRDTHPSARRTTSPQRARAHQIARAFGTLVSCSSYGMALRFIAEGRSQGFSGERSVRRLELEQLPFSTLQSSTPTRGSGSTSSAWS
jgi:transcriptional regulator with XRE-family HTH domain